MKISKWSSRKTEKDAINDSTCKYAFNIKKHEDIADRLSTTALIVSVVSLLISIIKIIMKA